MKDEIKEKELNNEDTSLSECFWLFLIAAAFAGSFSDKTQIDTLEGRVSRLEAKEEIIEKLFLK